MQSMFSRQNLPLLLVVLIWGANYTSIKLGLRELPPITWVSLRYTFGALFTFLWLALRRESLTLDRRDWLRLLLAGAVSFGYANVLVTIGLRYTSSANSSLLIASAPVLTALLAWATGSEAFWPAKAAGVAVSFTGAALLLGGNGAGFGALAASTGSLRGDLLTLAGAAMMSAYPLIVLPALGRNSALSVTAWTFAFAALAAWPIASSEFSRIDLSRLTLLTPATVLYSSLPAAALAQVLWNDAISRLGATQVQVYLFLPPLAAAAVSAAVLGEAVRLNQVTGALVIFAGLYLVKRPAPASASFLAAPAASLASPSSKSCPSAAPSARNSPESLE